MGEFTSFPGLSGLWEHGCLALASLANLWSVTWPGAHTAAGACQSWELQDR